MSPPLNLWYLLAHPDSASLAVGSPAWLVLLAGAAVFFLIGRRDTPARRAAACLRCGAYGATVLALAGLTLATRLPDDRLSLIAVLDVSQSIDAHGRRWQERYVERAAAALAPGDEIGVVKFGRDAAVVRPPGPPHSGVLAQAPVRESGTDIARALDTALALFPPDVERRIVLLTDGHQTHGDALAVIPRALRSRTAIYAAVPPHAGGADAAVEKLLVPPVVARGAVFPVRLVVRNRGRAREARLSLHLDDELLGEDRVSLEPGLNAIEIPYRLQEEGTRRLRAAVSLPDDIVPANNHREASLTVGGEPRVLLVSKRSRPPIAALLERKNIQVSSRSPAALPQSAGELSGYDAVVLEDPTAADLDAVRLVAIERYVRELGGGLVVAAGRMTYGDPGFKSTPLERLLPVTLEPRRPPRVDRQPLALFVLIDRSNSMGYHFRNRLQRSESESKLIYAKRAALAVLSQLKDSDFVGVNAFDSSLFEVAPLRRVSENRKLLEEHIPRLQPGGGTDFFDALEAAHRQLVDARVSAKHVILLTDGDTNRSAEGYRDLIARVAADGITVSTIRIGDDLVNLRLLEDISRRTGGQFYHVEDAESLPELMLRDTSKALAQVERSGEIHAPRRRVWNQILAGVDVRAIPELHGCAYTRPRPGADVLLDVAAAERDDPVLAVWQYGLGRVAALTASPYDDAEMWMGWDGLGKLWSQLVRWAARPFSLQSYAVDIERVEGESIMRVKSFGDLGDSVLRARLRPHPERAIDVPLVPQSPRVFAARLPALLPGRYPVTIVRRSASGQVSESIQTVTFPAGDAQPQEEIYAETPSRLLLDRLTAATGGAVDAPLRDVVRRQPGSRRVEHPLDWLLLPLAMALFLTDIGLRRASAP